MFPWFRTKSLCQLMMYHKMSNCSTADVLTCLSISPVQSPRYLDLLGVLCVCEGVAMPENQSYVCKKWLVDDNVRMIDVISVI